MAIIATTSFRTMNRVVSSFIFLFSRNPSFPISPPCFRITYVYHNPPKNQNLVAASSRAVRQTHNSKTASNESVTHQTRNLTRLGHARGSYLVNGIYKVTVNRIRHRIWSADATFASSLAAGWIADRTRTLSSRLDPSNVNSRPVQIADGAWLEPEHFTLFVQHRRLRPNSIGPFGWCIVPIPSYIASIMLYDFKLSEDGDGKLRTTAVKKVAIIKRVS
jgi:hypothetical protein